MMMDGHSRVGRHRNFQHAYEGVFEDHLVPLGRGQHRVKSVGKIGFVLSIDSEMQDVSPLLVSFRGMISLL